MATFGRNSEEERGEILMPGFAVWLADRLGDLSSLNIS